VEHALAHFTKVVVAEENGRKVFILPSDGIPRSAEDRDPNPVESVEANVRDEISLDPYRISARKTAVDRFARKFHMDRQERSRTRCANRRDKDNACAVVARRQSNDTPHLDDLWLNVPGEIAHVDVPRFREDSRQ
jgi:hypothetical protein